MKYFTTYNKDEFLPIYVEGKLDNLDEFIAYKLKKAGNAVVDGLNDAYFALGGRSSLNS